MPGDAFEDFWEEVEEYAEKTGLDTSYLEEEFILDGELVKVNINYKKQSQ